MLAARSHARPGADAMALKRILVVDDDADNRRLVAACLRTSDVVIEEACDGLSAFHCVVDRPPDLVILDMDLPVLDGYSAAQMIRSCALRAAAVPIIALTAEVDDAAARCLLAGADDYMAKPLTDPRLLRAKVRARLDH